MSDHSLHYANCAVPEHERRGTATMGLLWITMVTAFPTVLIGFEWFKLGISLSQVITCSVLACLLLLAYTIPTVYVSAKTGKGYGLLNIETFGTKGALAVNVLLLVMFVSFYGLAALLLAEGLNSLFHTNFPLAPSAAIIALLMALNNFFGFSGVANFARYVAAPVLIVWVAYTFAKVAPTCPADALIAQSQQTFSFALSTVSSFIIGFAIWGNEGDYWRFSRPGAKKSIVPLAIALAIGEVIFPVTGWMVAHYSGITDYAKATDFMSNYSFGGLPLLGALVLTAAYFACNDSNLFGSSTTLELVVKMKHRKSVSFLAIVGAIIAYGLATFGAQQSLEFIASLNCIFLPTPTVIAVTNWFLAKRYHELDQYVSPSYKSACIALVMGIATGLLSSKLIPGIPVMEGCIPCLQAWLVASLSFATLRSLDYKNARDIARTNALMDSSEQNVLALVPVEVRTR